MDLLAKEGSLTEDERIKKEDYSRELERSIYLEEVSWIKKKKVKCSLVERGRQQYEVFFTVWQICIGQIIQLSP